MKRGIIRNEIKNFKSKLSLATIILIIAIAFFLVYFFYLKFETCEDLNCYEIAKQNCKRISYIKDDPSAVYNYKILGKSGDDACKIKVTLLTLKEGDIDTENLQGKSMVCDIFKSDTDFPEDDVSQCTGKLREEIQELMIQRMHNYLIENLIEIQEGFEKLDSSNLSS